MIGSSARQRSRQTALGKRAGFYRESRRLMTDARMDLM